MNDGRTSGDSPRPERKKDSFPKQSSARRSPSKGRWIPPGILAEARRLEVGNGLPRAVALKVAKGEMQLKEALGMLLLQEKVERLIQSKTLMMRYATPVIRGVCTLEHALFLSAIAYRKAADDYRACHLDNYVGTATALVLGLVDKRTVTGTVVSSLKYDVVIKPLEGDEQTIPKHDVKFYFEASSKKSVLKHLEWGSKELRTAPGTLASVKARKDLPARVFMAPQLAGKSISLANAEGDLLRGRIVWLGKFEVVLELGPGTEVVVLRHCLVSIAS